MICMSRRFRRRSAALSFCKIGPLEADFSGVRFNQPEDRAAGGGFTATGFTNESKRFAAFDFEADVVHGFHVSSDTRQDAAPDRKVFFQIANAEEGIGILRHEYTVLPAVLRWARAGSRDQDIRACVCSIEGQKNNPPADAED